MLRMAMKLVTGLLSLFGASTAWFYRDGARKNCATKHYMECGNLEGICDRCANAGLDTTAGLVVFTVICAASFAVALSSSG